MPSLSHRLPAGTALFIGVVRMGRLTGRLVHHQGRFARAALPFVVPLRWGWHRGERAMARGTVPRAGLFEHADTGCLAHLPVAPVRLGAEERALVAIDTSTSARRRAGARVALAGQGCCPRAGRAVRANLGAAATSLVSSGRGRVGLGRRTRWGARGEEAVAALVHAFPPRARQRLSIVAAGLATQERFAAATAQEALGGRWRINGKRRCAPPPPRGPRGQPTWHGPGLPPGALLPEVEPAAACPRPGDKGAGRGRRWHARHGEEARHPSCDVLRIDDPASARPWGVGTTARELTTDAFLPASPPRWPVETNCFVAQDTTTLERPRAWTQKALERRISLSLRTGSRLQAIAAATQPWAMGPWERKPMPSAGRLAHYLESHAAHFSALALKGVEPRNDRVMHKHTTINELQQLKTA